MRFLIMTRLSAGGNPPGQRPDHEGLKTMVSVQMDVTDVDKTGMIP
jgi:hypothetical protein